MHLEINLRIDPANAIRTGFQCERAVRPFSIVSPFHTRESAKRIVEKEQEQEHE
jgi:hypothetical protein